jgi:hypothetical protein
MNTSTKNQSNDALHATLPTRRLRTVLVGALTSAALLGACTSSSAPNTTTDTASVATDALLATTDPSSVATDPGADGLVDTAAGGPADSVATTTVAAGNATPAGGAVLPVPSNPITNVATAQTLKIDSVLVENNLDANGKAASDHLEIALSNSGSIDSKGIEVFYVFTDPTTGTTENYYTRLPDDFTVPAGGKRVVHFDDTGVPDHFPVNKFSLYYTSSNALDVSVTVSAKDAAVQTFDLKKDAGGAEAAD